MQLELAAFFLVLAGWSAIARFRLGGQDSATGRRIASLAAPLLMIGSLLPCVWHHPSFGLAVWMMLVAVGWVFTAFWAALHGSSAKRGYPLLVLTALLLILF